MCGVGLWGGLSCFARMEPATEARGLHPGPPRSCSILLRQDGTHYGSERTSPGAPRWSLRCEAENHTRGPRIRVPSCSDRMEPTTEARGLHPGPPHHRVKRDDVGWAFGVGHPGSPRSCSILPRQDGTYYGSVRTSPGVPGLPNKVRKSGVGLGGLSSNNLCFSLTM